MYMNIYKKLVWSNRGNAPPIRPAFFLRACAACVSQFCNDPGFSNVSHVAVVGLLGTLFSFSGFEASAHMAEDIHGARKVQSKS